MHSLLLAAQLAATPAHADRPENPSLTHRQAMRLDIQLRTYMDAVLVELMSAMNGAEDALSVCRKVEAQLNAEKDTRLSIDNQEAGTIEYAFERHYSFDGGATPHLCASGVALQYNAYMVSTGDAFCGFVANHPKNRPPGLSAYCTDIIPFTQSGERVSSSD